MAHVLPIAASFFQPHSLSHALLTKVITKGGSAEVYTSGSAASDASLRQLELDQLRAEGTDKMAIAKATRETSVAMKMVAP